MCHFRAQQARLVLLIRSSVFDSLFCCLNLDLRRIFDIGLILIEPGPGTTVSLLLLSSIFSLIRVNWFLIVLFHLLRQKKKVVAIDVWDEARNKFVQAWRGVYNNADTGSPVEVRFDVSLFRCFVRITSATTTTVLCV